MASKNVITATDDNFEAMVLKSETPVMVDFWATWCGPCKAIAPHVDSLADAYVGTAKVAKVDVDTAPGVAKQFKVRSIPTVLFFQNGEVADMVVGAVPKKDLEKKLKSLL